MCIHFIIFKHHLDTTPLMTAGTVGCMMKEYLQLPTAQFQLNIFYRITAVFLHAYVVLCNFRLCMDV